MPQMIKFLFWLLGGDPPESTAGQRPQSPPSPFRPPNRLTVQDSTDALGIREIFDRYHGIGLLISPPIAGNVQPITLILSCAHPRCGRIHRASHLTVGLN